MNKREAFLRPAKVAKYTGLSVDFIKDLIEKEELENVEINGSPRVRMTEVERWLDEEAKPEELIKMAGKLEGEIDIEEVAETLEMDKEKVEEYLKHADQ